MIQNEIKFKVETCEQSTEDDFIFSLDEMVDYVSRLDDLLTLTYVDVEMIHFSRRTRSVKICFDNKFFEKHGFRAIVLDASDIHTAPVMFNLIVTKIHESMKQI